MNPKDSNINNIFSDFKKKLIAEFKKDSSKKEVILTKRIKALEEAIHESLVTQIKQENVITSLKETLESIILISKKTLSNGK